jgi:hypothetical protein
MPPVLAVMADVAGRAPAMIALTPALAPEAADPPGAAATAAGAVAGATGASRNVTRPTCLTWPAATRTMAAPAGQEAPPDHWSTYLPSAAHAL